MLKFGIISEIDFKNGLARVNFGEDGYVSAPLKIAVVRSGADKFSFPFDINEHVYCLMDENEEYGVICGAVYDEKNIPDSASGPGILSFHFGDSSSILYDRNSHTLSLDIKGKVNIKCEEADVDSSGKVSVKASEVEVTAVKTKIVGNLEVTGTASVVGVVSMGGIAGISGAAVAGSTAVLNVKEVSATDDVTAGVVSLKTHKHTSAASGSPTSTPIP